MRLSGTVNPWSSRLLMALCLVLSFVVPYSGGKVAENAFIARWERYGFSPEQTLDWWDNGVYSRETAIAWRAKDFVPSEIKSWQAMDIPPDEAGEWRDAGADITTAVEWRRYAFAPEKAAAWMRFQFTIGDAIAWRKYGFEAEEAAAWREKGMSAAGAVRAKRGGGAS